MPDGARERCHMHRYLLAWRQHRGLSQEAVGAELGVRHTTIGRWESGEVSLSARDLESLAKVYRCTVTQLIVDPADAELVERLDRAQAIMKELDPDTLDHWLALGDRLAQK